MSYGFCEKSLCPNWSHAQKFGCYVNEFFTRRLLTRSQQVAFRKWDGDTKILNWKQKVNEQDFLETQEDAKKEAYEQGKKLGFEKGFDTGKLKGEAKGISVILKHDKDANLQKEFSITQTQEDQIKKLTQPPAVDQIADILLDSLVDESHQDSSDQDSWSGITLKCILF